MTPDRSRRRGFPCSRGSSQFSPAVRRRSQTIFVKPGSANAMKSGPGRPTKWTTGAQGCVTLPRTSSRPGSSSRIVQPSARAVSRKGCPGGASGGLPRPRRREGTVRIVKSVRTIRERLGSRERRTARERNHERAHQAGDGEPEILPNAELQGGRGADGGPGKRDSEQRPRDRGLCPEKQSQREDRRGAR